MNNIVKSVGKGLASAGSTLLSIQFYTSIILFVAIIIGLVVFNIMYKPSPQQKDPQPIRLNVNIAGAVFLVILVLSIIFSYFGRQNPYVSGADAAVTGFNLIGNLF
jgi:NADH:ubiquinone oxidoreductase subunit 6 (subunit J)